LRIRRLACSFGGIAQFRSCSLFILRNTVVFATDRRRRICGLPLELGSRMICNWLVSQVRIAASQYLRAGSICAKPREALIPPLSRQRDLGPSGLGAIESSRRLSGRL